FGVDRECPHHGFGGSYRSHFYDHATQNAAVATEGDEIELHAFDPDLGLVLNHEIEAAAIVGVLDTVELDADLFLSCGRCDRQQDVQNDERKHHTTHGSSPRSPEAAITQVRGELVTLDGAGEHAQTALIQRFSHVGGIDAREVLSGERLHHCRHL